jgi:hypothetical protein
MDNVLITIHGAQKKNQQTYWREKITITENQNNPPVPSITPLFNLLAQRNTLNQKSVLVVCVCFSLFVGFFFVRHE